MTVADAPLLSVKTGFRPKVCVWSDFVGKIGTNAPKKLYTKSEHADHLYKYRMNTNHKYQSILYNCMYIYQNIFKYSYYTPIVDCTHILSHFSQNAQVFLTLSFMYKLTISGL